LANGDRTALIIVDTKRDTGSAGVGVLTRDAGGDPAAAEGVIDANDDTPTGAALTTAGFAPVFAEPDPGSEVAPRRCRASVPGVCRVARVPAPVVEEVEVDEVRELLAAVSPGGFSGRR
jgi:hypothetical protein